jgi:hypothetical protein
MSRARGALSSEKLYEAIVSFSDAIEDFVERLLSHGGRWVDCALYPLAKNVEHHKHERGNRCDRKIRVLTFEYPGKDSDADEPNSKNR